MVGFPKSGHIIWYTYYEINSLSTINGSGKVYVVLPITLCPVHWYSPLSFSVNVYRMEQNSVSPSDNIMFGPGTCISCVILLLSILLHVQYGGGLPLPSKGQEIQNDGAENCLDTVIGTKSIGTNGATIEMKT